MATHVNLLDWRSKRRERRQKEFLTMLGGIAVLALAVAVLVTMSINARVSAQQVRNNYLKAQIRQADHEIAQIKDLTKLRDNLIARMHVIEGLQQDRSATVHFFDELVNTLPSGVYLTSVKQDGTHVTLTGVAQSNGRVSEYMKNLDASPWFDNPRLVVIKTHDDNNQHRSDFTLLIDSVRPKAPATKGAGA
ncbi:MAG TPA: PilN domain-containing protein [Nevskiaceae bacterium]|nr:PilN domain-containing protein [Nevskiaceae bacterium]